MNMTTTRLRPPTILAPAAMLALALLASCGGVGSGGTGRSGTGFAAGTVDGFGSVIVDGVSYDDQTAAIVVETAPGHDVLADIELGQRVSVEYSTPGVASVVRVDGAVSGVVATIVANGFTVLGQTVLVNNTGTAGPITQFGGGYAGAADLRAGDAVDVHGLLVAQGASYVIQATRVDKLTAPPAYLRATGIVAALSTATRSFSLAALTVDAGSATLVPAGTSIVTGQTVTVLAPSVSLTGAVAGPRVQAAEVRVRTLEPALLATYLSGTVSLLDSTAHTFVLDGHVVSYAMATLSPGTAVLANGLYVQASGSIAGDGSLVAASITLRDAGSNDEAELHGNISAFDAASSTFSVRGVRVDASTASLSGCPSTLANGLFVEVHGATVSDGVRARTIACESESSGSTVEREGTASAVDAAGRSFSLTPEGGAAIRVSWSDTTFFGDGLTATTLGGKSVQVEGSLVSGALVATKISLND